jgi:hypothetical protein
MSDQQHDEAPVSSELTRYSRSTPLRPAIWMTGVLVWATVVAFLFHVPTWAGIFLCGLTGLSFLFYLISYVYLMATDREALRREKFSVKELPQRQLGQLNVPLEQTIRAQQPQLGTATQPLDANEAMLWKDRGREAEDARVANGKDS